jgi:hypothetical protein
MNYERREEAKLSKQPHKSTNPNLANTKPNDPQFKLIIMTSG